MDYTQVKDMQSRFDNLVRRVPGENIEFWFARDLQELLGYDSWITFSSAMRRAINACNSIDYASADHFYRVMREAILGGDVECDVEDFMLTRYACYLIAQHGDSQRMTIRFAQSYFAIHTLKQKRAEDRMRLQALIDAHACSRDSGEFLPNCYERGIDDEDFGRIRVRGGAALLGGMQGQRGAQMTNPAIDDVRKLARRLKSELRGLVRNLLT